MLVSRKERGGEKEERRGRREEGGEKREERGKREGGEREERGRRERERKRRRIDQGRHTWINDLMSELDIRREMAHTQTMDEFMGEGAVVLEGPPSNWYFILRSHHELYRDHLLYRSVSDFLNGDG